MIRPGRGRSGRGGSAACVSARASRSCFAHACSGWWRVEGEASRLAQGWGKAAFRGLGTQGWESDLGPLPAPPALLSASLAAGAVEGV